MLKKYRGIFIGTAESGVVAICTKEDHKLDPTLKSRENCTVILDDKKPVRRIKRGT